MLKQISHFLSDQQDTLVEDSVLQIDENDLILSVPHRQDLADSLFEDQPKFSSEGAVIFTDDET